MNAKNKIIAGLATLSIMLAGQSHAHFGETDSTGCHFDPNYFGYHCHDTSGSQDTSGSGDWENVGVILVGLILLSSLVDTPQEGVSTTKQSLITRDYIAEVLQHWSGEVTDISSAIDKLIMAGFTQRHFDRIHDPDVQVWIGQALSQ